jgi:hypothetical protein
MYPLQGLIIFAVVTGSVQGFLAMISRGSARLFERASHLCANLSCIQCGALQLGPGATMVSPTPKVLNGEIQHKTQSAHQAGKAAQVKHQEEYANSIALKRRDNQARSLPWPAPVQGRYQTLRRFRRLPAGSRIRYGASLPKLGLRLESEKTRSGRIYRIVRAKTSAPSPSASGIVEQGDA